MESEWTRSRFEGLFSRAESAVAGRVGGEWMEQARTRLYDELDRGLVRVALIGRFNTGKSTLIDAIIGSDLMPRDAVPTTAVVAEVSSGAQEKLALVSKAGERLLDRESFQRMARGADGAGTELRVLRATLPGIDLPDGVALVDTPGVDSLDDVHAEITYGYLGACDAILFLLDGQTGTVTQDEIDFLRDHILKRDKSKLVFVVTRADMDGNPPEVQTRVVNEIKGVLHRLPGLELTPVVQVNALKAYEARLAGRKISEAGLEALWQTLEQHLFRRLVEMRAGRVKTTLCEIVSSACGIIAQHKEALSLDDPALVEKVKAAEQALRAVRDALTAAKGRFAESRSRFKRDLEREVDRLVGRVAQKAPGYVRALLDNPQAGDKVTGLIQADVAREVEALGEDWLRPKLTDLLREFDIAADLERIEVQKFGFEDVRMPGGALLDIVLDIGVFVLIDVVLPGGFLEALVARVLAKGVFDKIRDVLKKAVLNLIQGLIRGLLEKQVADGILAIGAPLQDALVGQSNEFLSTAASKLEAAYQGRLAEVARTIEAAREERTKGAEKIRESVREDERAIEQLKVIESECAA